MYVKHFMTFRVPTCFRVGQIANYLNLLDPGWEIGQFEAVFCLHTENKSPVRAVEKEDIDIIGLQSFEALYTTIDEVVTVVATVVGLAAGGQIRLGGY